MASKTFSYPELQKVVDISYSQAVTQEDSIPSAVAYAIWCWIHNQEEVTDHSPVSATTEPVKTETAYIREYYEGAVGDLTARVDILETDLENLKFKLSQV